MELLVMVILVVVLAIILFALLILIGFAYLFVKSFEEATKKDETSIPDQTISGKDEYTPDFADNDVPLTQFTPDFKKKVKVVYKETPQGVEEVEEEV